MLTLEIIMQLLKDKNVQYLADQTGLPYQTVRRIKKGEIARAQYHIIKKLSDYFVDQGYSTNHIN